MANQVIKIRKGADIKLKGAAPLTIKKDVTSNTYALKPTDFHGVIPKLVVKQGDNVKAGSILFYDKYNEAVKFASPVSGEVIEINRGAKRKLLEIVVLADKEILYESFPATNPESLSKEQVISQLCQAGLWPFIRQRPFSVIANPTDEPKSIFISGFDTNPLAPDYEFILKDKKEELQTAINALSKLTNGKINIGISSKSSSSIFNDLKGVQVSSFSGPHPAGNVGVQIHHLDPINKGETVWYLDAQNLLYIGRLFLHGKHDVSKTIAITGSEAKDPAYFNILTGIQIESVLENQLTSESTRIISGNALSGDQVEIKGYLGYYHDQITLLPEVQAPQMFGWITPNLNKLSFSRALPSFLFPNKKYELTTSMNGEERAYVVSGQYEKFLPMDIYPVHLIKSILTNDIEKMEQLGIYEVAPEDFALCEFACTSKQEVQKIVREGLDVIQKEFS